MFVLHNLGQDVLTPLPAVYFAVLHHGQAAQVVQKVPDLFRFILIRFNCFEIEIVIYPKCQGIQNMLGFGGVRGQIDQKVADRPQRIAV